MGIVTDAFRELVPSRKAAEKIVSSFPLFPPILTPPAPEQPFEAYAREGYMQNDLVYQAIQMLCTSAAEPEIAAYRYPGGNKKKKEAIYSHPVLDLLENPNPFMSPYQMVAGIRLYRAIAGNAYLLKVRSAAGRVVQLWPLRPDRVRVIPDQQTFIRGYTYQPFGVPYIVPRADIIHFKNLHPMDMYYGLPPLAPLAARVDIDNWMRSFVAAFFRNGGVPSGMLTLTRTLADGERELIRSRFQRDYGGPGGWHSLLVLDQSEDADAKYTPMGMPLGERGLVLPDLNHISEERIAGCLGIPSSLLGTVSGRGSSSYANRVSDRESFWHETLAPMYREDGDALTMGLISEYPSTVDEISFDLGTVQALIPDRDKEHDRVRADALAGLITREAAMAELDYPEPKAGEVWVLASTTIVTPVGEEVAPAVPETPSPEEQQAADAALADQESMAGEEPAPERRNGHTAVAASARA